jgi:hypothetical protein
MIPLSPGEEIRLYWSTPAGQTQLKDSEAQINPHRPAVPPLIVTVNQVR